MEARQLGFGWTIEDHRDRDQRLSRIYLPRSITVDDGAVAEDKIRFLLHRLNYHAQGDRECWPSVQTLAAEMGVEEKTVRRAVQASIRLGLVSVKRKKAQLLSCNHYSIEWAAVESRGVRLQHPELLDDQPDIRTGTNRTYVPEATGHAGPTNRTYVPLGGDQSDIRTGTNRTPVPTTMVMVDGYQKPSPQPARLGGGGFRKMIWGRQLSDRELLDDNSIDVLFGAAVRCGFARDDEPDRQRFAALVVNIRRTKAKSRAGLLTCVIEGRVINKHVAPGADPRDWRHRATDADRDEARRILKRIDGIAGPAQTSTPAANLETDAHEWRERERQLAAIANFKVGSTS